jgi:nucleotide-binding universal stress UspA family protein
LPEAPGIAVEYGTAAEEILNQVIECSADLIVMGTQGLEGTKRLVFGSTTERVLRESRVPVLAVPAPPDSQE